MKNMKFWRTALVATLVLTVMLSVTGGTIAWFTDTVTSGANVIQSGTLDITVRYGDAKTEPSDSWTDIENTSEALFSHDLWEPGYVASKGVQIVNKGTLALKFELEFLPSEATTGNFKLEDVIDVYVSKSPVAGRIALGAYVGTLASLMNSEDEDGAVHGELLAGATDTVYISLKMQESAGNDYQNLSVGNGFGLKIVATQLNHESDSFDSDYDKDADAYSADTWDGTSDSTWNDEEAENALTEYVIMTAEEFAGFRDLVNGGNTFAGKIVKLGNNLDLNNIEWEPIGGYDASKVFSGTFDGQGYSIKNLSITEEGKTYLGLFSNIANATITNLTVQDATISASATNAYAAVLAAKSVACNISNVTFDGVDVNVQAGNGAFAAVIVGDNWQSNNDTMSLNEFAIRNATISVKAKVSYAGGAFADLRYGENGVNSITNGTVDNLKITSDATNSSNAGGLLGYTYRLDPLKVENVNVTNLDIDFTGSSSKVGGITGYDGSVSRNGGGYKNVTVSGTIDENATGQTGSEVGGFVGVSHQYPKTYTSCSADVDINTKFVGGGFTGSSCVNLWGGQYDTYVGCTASGDVTAPFAGGFVAHAINNNSYLTMTDINVTGNIHGTTMGGGIISTTTGSAKNITITNAKVTGNITGGTVAGVCANTLMASGNTLTLENVETTLTPLYLPAGANVVINNTNE